MSKKFITKIKASLIRFPYTVGAYHFFKSLPQWPGFFRDYFLFKNDLKQKDDRFSLEIQELFPCLLDKTGSHNFEPHYTYHPAWAARVVNKIKPAKHIDISSTLHFSTIVSAFIPVEFYDFRPAKIFLEGLETKAGNLLNLPFDSNSVESLSCMHVLEHVGLGRYGDKIDSLGDILAAKELARVIKVGGNLIMVVPIGQPKIQYNAHRIYSYDQLVDMFSDSMNLKEFSLIPDSFEDNGIIINATREQADNQKWGCGCFWFVKK